MSAKVLIIGKGCRTRELLKKALSENDEIKVVQYNSDLISRKKLIEDLTNQKYSFDIETPKSYEKTIREMAYKQHESVLKCINNQPQVQPIVKTAEEIVEMLNRISCPECDRNSSHCYFSEKDCKNYWFEWLTKKEV